MSANTAPIFTRIPSVQGVADITAANTNADLTSGTSYLLFTADATNGSYLESITLKTNPANSSVATVLRVWINNGSTLGTSANTWFLKEISIPAVTATSTQATQDFECPIGKVLGPGHKVYLTLGTAPGGSAKFSAIGFGGHY